MARNESNKVPASNLSHVTSHLPDEQEGKSVQLKRRSNRRYILFIAHDEPEEGLNDP